MLRDPSLIPLSHQHQHGLALTVLIDRDLKATPTQEKALELSRKVALMAEVELFGHFQVEEKVLFPAVRSKLGSSDVIEELIEQHRKLEYLVEQVANADENTRIALITGFGELLHRHIRIEERQLFQDIQATLSEDQLAELGEQVDTNVQKVCPVTDQLPWQQDD